VASVTAALPLPRPSPRFLAAVAAAPVLLGVAHLLPETGAGAGDSGMGWAFWALVVGGAFVGAGGLLFAWRRVKA